jgi:hypothetical protein
VIVRLWGLMHPLGRSLARVSMYGATALALVLGCFAPRADAADIKFEPSVLLSEEYNDNVHLQGNQDKADAFITRFAPSVLARYNTLFWTWDITYTYSYYDYYFFKKYNNAGGKEADHDQTHALDAKNHTVLLNDFLFLDVSDEYSRVSQNIAVDYTQQSPAANQVDQNVFTTNPFVVFHPLAATRAVFGYIFQETRYRNSAADTQVLIDRKRTIRKITDEQAFMPDRSIRMRKTALCMPGRESKNLLSRIVLMPVGNTGSGIPASTTGCPRSRLLWGHAGSLVKTPNAPSTL